MPLERFYYPGLSIYSYLLYDEKAKHCVAIDPIREVAPYVRFAEEKKLEITDILETHVHADFVSGAKELKARLGGRPAIHCSGMGGVEWVPYYADHIVKDREIFSIGSLRIQAWHTPGHTPEHLIWVIYDDSRAQQNPWIAFTGDMIFVGSLGRPDLLGSDFSSHLTKLMYNSVFNVVSKLPDYLEIFPAHGAGSLCGKEIKSSQSSTLGYERQYNPGLMIKDESKWAAEMQKNLPVYPQYFKVLKKINLVGPPLIPTTLPKTLTSIQELDDLFVIDVRDPEEFAAAHVPGSINIPLGPSFTSWAGAVVPYDEPLALILGKESSLEEVLTCLRVIGYDNIAGYADITSLKKEQMTSFPMIPIETLVLKLQDNETSLYVLDVRTDSEWQSGHIKGAHRIELNALPNAIPSISKQTPIAILCARGNRASIAASLLEKKGFKNVSNVRGGMQAWNKSKLPTDQ